MLNNSRSASLHGEREREKKKTFLSVVSNYTPLYGSESVTSMPWLLKCHGVLKSNSAEAKVDTFPLNLTFELPGNVLKKSLTAAAPGLTTCSPAHIQHCIFAGHSVFGQQYLGSVLTRISSACGKMNQGKGITSVISSKKWEIKKITPSSSFIWRIKQDCQCHDEVSTPTLASSVRWAQFAINGQSRSSATDIIYKSPDWLCHPSVYQSTLIFENKCMIRFVNLCNKGRSQQYWWREH